MASQTVFTNRNVVSPMDNYAAQGLVCIPTSRVLKKGPDLTRTEKRGVAVVPASPRLTSVKNLVNDQNITKLVAGPQKTESDPPTLLNNARGPEVLPNHECRLVPKSGPYFFLVLHPRM